MNRTYPIARELAARLGLREPMQRTAVALAANTGLTSVLGFAYWVTAAHYYSPGEIGESAALISAMLLMANIAGLNLNNTLIRFLPTAGSDTVRYVRRAYLAVIAASLLVGIAAIPLLAHLALVRRLAELGFAGVVFLIVAVLAWPLFSLQDAVTIGARAAPWVPVENTAFGIGKLLLLVALAGIGQLGIVVSWLAAMLAALAGMTTLLFRRLLPRHAHESQMGRTEHISRRDVTGFLTVDNVALLTGAATIYLLPVVVVTRAGSEANGYFYVAWSVGSALDLALVNVASTLVVEGSRQRDRLGALTAVLLRRTAIVAVPLVAAVTVTAPLILSIYGGAYAAHAADLLRLVAVTLLPRIFVVIWMSTNRVRQHLGRILAIQAAISVADLGLSWVLVPHHGIIVIGIVHLMAQTAAALVILPDLLGVIRTGRSGTSPIDSLEKGSEK